MSFIHDYYTYGGPAAFPVDQPLPFDPAMPHSSVVAPVDAYMYPHSAVDLMEMFPHGMVECDEYAETTTRPRLTKEQVDTLETQFQAQPKPSSNVKRLLAIQIGLSLPRVANWFQNRRAKAKQQKRQEEFERLQKAKAQSDGSVETLPKSDSATPTGPCDERPMAAQSTPVTTQPVKMTKTESTASSNKDRTQTARSKHQKTNSESAREATLASLQRALNAAVAARDAFAEQPKEDHVQPTTGSLDAPPASTALFNHVIDSQHVVSAPCGAQWELGATGTALAWSPSHNPDGTLIYQNLNGSGSFVSVTDALTDQDATYAHAQMRRPSSDWSHGLLESFESDAERSASTPGLPYSTSCSSLQPPTVTVSRRGSSDELAESLGSFGIDATGSAAGSVAHLPRRADATVWKVPGKELDLAARRKRPRPAAIGTSTSSRSLAGSSTTMSPTTRGPTTGGASHSLRLAKSTQNLHSRYAGVRKVSAAQRSPLTFSTFAEAGGRSASASAAKAETLLTATTLAPPTPLTPQNFQHLMPSAAHAETGYCLSRNTFFPTTQATQIKIASPPATPLEVDLYPGFQWQSLAPPPPWSAPAHFTTFSDYPSCESVPLTARSWAEASAPLLSPNTTALQECIPMPRPMHAAVPGKLESTGDHLDIGLALDSPSTIYSSHAGPAAIPAPCAPVSSTDAKPTEFFIQEFPEQQEVHRFVAQQLSAQPPKDYTFTHRTLHDFPS